ncbi:hypothetical protein BGZ65_006955 [Modicella reniformis]|uniref:Uncharacterized protein n=1 Tax=Modicella reniformis TaxID=1440133 RepID=A0A9P6MB08_9FUNG|nr:hypothetical protein BGZ65_006955 [Modicella reniformis]
MHSSEAHHPEIANPNVDEYLRQEGMTEEEWKRIYDLRYCTILVPFAENQDEKENGAEDGEKSAYKDASRGPQTVTPVSSPIKTRGQRQPATPNTPQGRQHFPSSLKQKSAPRSPSSRTLGLLTPTEKRLPSNRRFAIKQETGISDDPEDDSADETKSFLTNSDPLSSYLITSRLESRRSVLITRSTELTTVTAGDQDTDAAEQETFHDAVDQHDDINEQTEKTGSPSIGKKRRHWEIEASSRLIQPTQSDPQRRIAITATTPNTSIVVSTGLLKQKAFTPNSSSTIWNRQGSEASDVPSGQDARRLSRESSPLLIGHREFDRQLTQPYPVQNRREVNGDQEEGTSSKSISNFLSKHRAGRSQRQREAEQNYQLKSVFKHRLASGLRTVGQLLPFWRDVEKGNVDIKEKVAVPLVPAGKAQAVIEAFETKEQEVRMESRTGSVCSVRGRERTRSSTGSTSLSETVAEMLARGHASRSASASSRSSSA